MRPELTGRALFRAVQQHRLVREPFAQRMVAVSIALNPVITAECCVSFRLVNIIHMTYKLMNHVQ